jgi:hypothetical protein
VYLPHDFRPPIDDRQHLVGLLGREHRHDAGNAHFIEALHPVEILAKCEGGDLEVNRRDQLGGLDDVALLK